MTNEPIVLRLEPDGEVIRVDRPPFSEQDFETFRQATEGLASYDRRRRGTFAEKGRLAALTKRFRDAGFAVTLSSECKRLMQEYSAAQMLDVQRVRERIREMDEDISKRTGFHLFWWQKNAAEWLSPRHAALLADDMGLGKTATAIVSFPPNAPVLVVCPHKVRSTWLAELALWRPYLRKGIVEGKNSFRWPNPGEVLIMNPEILPEVHDRDGVKGRKCTGLLPPEECTGCVKETSFVGGSIQTRTALGKHLPKCDENKNLLKPKLCPGCAPILDTMPAGLVMVGDEIHMYKEPKSHRTQRWRAMKTVVLQRHGRAWGLSGTPLENHPGEMWQVYKSLGIEKLAFGSYDRYAEMFEGQASFVGERFVGYRWPDLSSEEAAPVRTRIAERIKPAIQRVALRRLFPEVHTDLPPKRYQEIEVEVQRSLLARCDKFLKDVGGIDRVLEIIDKNKDVDGIKGLPELRQALAAAKIDRMLEEVETYEEHEEPLVVFSCHLAPIAALREREGWATISGKDHVDTGKILDDFKNGRLRGIGMTISGGHGLTLTRANTMLCVDLDWRPTMMDQVWARIYRIGQTRAVLYKMLRINHAVEKRVYELHAKKRGYIAASVDAAVTTHALPSDADQEIRELQQIAAQRGAVRRIAQNSEEEALVQRLHDARFAKLGDERLAMSLADEATSIGLSEPQWKLAARVLGRALPENGA